MQRTKIALSYIIGILAFVLFPSTSFANVSISSESSSISVKISNHNSVNIIKKSLDETPTIAVNQKVSNANTPLPPRLQRIRHRHTPTPTLPVKQLPTPTKSSVITPTPTKLPIPTKMAPTPISTKGLTLTTQQKFMIDAINGYRTKNGLYAVHPDSHTCAFAAVRAKEIVGNFNHDGFTYRVNNKSLPYPTYHSVTENIAMTSDYKQVVNMWINSPGHAANMRKDTPYVCVAQSGNYFAYEGWNHNQIFP